MMVGSGHWLLAPLNYCFFFPLGESFYCKDVGIVYNFKKIIEIVFRNSGLWKRKHAKLSFEFWFQPWSILHCQRHKEKTYKAAPVISQKKDSVVKRTACEPHFVVGTGNTEINKPHSWLQRLAALWKEPRCLFRTDTGDRRMGTHSPFALPDKERITLVFLSTLVGQRQNLKVCLAQGTKFKLKGRMGPEADLKFYFDQKREIKGKNNNVANKHLQRSVSGREGILQVGG